MDANPSRQPDATEMTRPAPTSSRGQDTRARIVQAGYETVRQVGIRRLTMESVAERAAVSRAALYRHFSNKQGLVDEVLEANARRMRKELEGLLADKERLGDQVAAAARFGQFPPRDLLLLGLSETDPVSLAVLLTTNSHRFIGRATRFWEPYVRAAQDRGEVPGALEADQAAEWIARAFFSLATTPAVTFDASDPAEFEAFARTYIMGGLLGSGPTLAE